MENINNILDSYNVISSVVPKNANKSRLRPADGAIMLKVYYLKKEIQPQRLAPDAINVLRIYPGNFTTSTTFKTVSFLQDTLVKTLLVHSLKKFRVTDQNPDNYYVVVTPLDELTGELISKGKVEYLSDKRILDPIENLNKVLASYGVQSFITENPDQSNGRRTSLSRIRQADRTIMISIYKIDSKKAVIGQISVYDGDLSNECEKIDIYADTLANDVIKKAKVRFQCDFEDSYALYSTLSKSFLDPATKLITIYEEAVKMKSKVNLVLKRVETATRDNFFPVGSNPVQLKSWEIEPSSGTFLNKSAPLANIPSRNISSAPGPVKKLSKKASRRLNSSSETQETLSQLQTSLNEFINESAESSNIKPPISAEKILKSKPRVGDKMPVIEPGKEVVPVQQILNSIDKELENIREWQLVHTIADRKRSRLSQLYNLNKSSITDDVDSDAVFADLKEIGNKFNKLERV
jgi:hypothetical protein